MKQKWILVFVVVLAISLGCSLTNIIKDVEKIGEQASEVAEEVSGDEGDQISEEAEDATGEDSSTEAGEPSEFDPQALEKLDSYRITVEFRFEHADGTVEEQSIEIAHTREPNAEHIVMKGATGEEQIGEIETIQIENQQWTSLGEGWMYGEIQEGEELIGEALNVDEINEDDLGEARDLGLETVNGIRSRHYELDDEMAIFSAPNDHDEMVGEIEEAHGDLWIAEEEGLPAFLVRYEVEVIGKASEDNPVEKFFVTMNVTDVNTDIVIEAPAEAEAETGTEAGAETSGAVGDIPIMENAQNKTVMGDIIVYETESDFQSVVDFYVAEMESTGWTKAATTINMDDLLMETWTKDGSSLQLNIAADENTGLVAVTIMKENGE